MTQHLEALKVGQPLLVSGPELKITYRGFGSFEMTRDPENPITRKNFGGIAGGTGITPIYSIMYHSLTHEDKSTNSLIYANHTPDDYLLKEQIDELAKYNKKDFKIHHCISKGEMSSSEENISVRCGRITKECIEKHMPAPGPDTFIGYCGPAAFNK